MTLSNSALDDAYNGIESGVNAGSAVGNPRLSFQTAGDVVLHEILLDTDALGAPSDGVGVYNPPNGEASWVDFTITIGAVTGTVAKAVLYNRDNVEKSVEDVSTVVAGTGAWKFSTTAWTEGLELTFSAAPTFTVQDEG